MQVLLETLVMPAFFQKVAPDSSIFYCRVAAFDPSGEHEVSGLACRHAAAVGAAPAAEFVAGVIAVTPCAFNNVEKSFPAHDLSRNLSAVRSARAIIVRAGLTASALGKTELSQI